LASGYFVPERGFFLGARAAGARSASLVAWTSFESFFADELGAVGHFGLANSIRHCGPPEKSDVSAATNAGASPPKIQMWESGGADLQLHHLRFGRKPQHRHDRFWHRR